jgi:hypothetical protein
MSTIRHYKQLIGLTLNKKDEQGNTVEVKITGYTFIYDEVFRQTDGHAGCMIHTFELDDNTSFTCHRIGELFRRYGDLVES